MVSDIMINHGIHMRVSLALSLSIYVHLQRRTQTFTAYFVFVFVLRVFVLRLCTAFGPRLSEDVVFAFLGESHKSPPVCVCVCFQHWDGDS